MILSAGNLSKTPSRGTMEQIINIDRMEHAAALFGSFDANIKIIEDAFGVRVHARDSELKISGDAEGVLKIGRAHV